MEKMSEMQTSEQKLFQKNHEVCKMKYLTLLLLAVVLGSGCVSKARHNQELREYFTAGVIVGREQGKEAALDNLKTDYGRTNQ